MSKYQLENVRRQVCDSRRQGDQAYASFADTLPIIKLGHDPLQLLLQADPPGTFFVRRGRQGKDPLLQDGPQVRPRLFWLNGSDIILLCCSLGFRIHV